jgi:hypothetical protein
MSELRFEIHRSLGPAVTAADVDEVAALVVSGRSGAGAVQIGDAPDITDVSELGVREKDSGSVYRPPCEQKWCTLDHLDLEAHIVEQAKAPRRQRVTPAQALAAVLRTDLTPAQADAVIAMLTADTATVPLNAAAGSGKSHTMAVFSRLWTEHTGARVIGLTASTNAAEVLAGEGLGETYNIAQFVGKVKDSDELRWPVRIGPDDVLVVDEATQVPTADMALLQQAARAAGARLYPVGDTAQLGSVDAGGIFHLLVSELSGPRMDEILRFDHEWEAAASLQLAQGDIEAVAVYGRRGRITAGDKEAVFDQAATMALSDRLAGKDALLLAGSNAEAADLARRVQGKLVQIGEVGAGQAELSDGNLAGLGDRIRARLNAKIDAGGRELTNRDTLVVDAVGGEHVWARRQLSPGGWSEPFRVPLGYLATDAELDYAGNVHVAEGRTVDGPSRLVVTETLNRASNYVGMTRSRSENHAYVVTGNTAPPGHEPYEQATAEQVIKSVLEREGSELSATEQMRAAQDWSAGAGHVLHLWSVAVRRDLYPVIDAQITARLTQDQAARYERDFARQALHAKLRQAQLAGHDLDEVIARITDEDLGGSRSVAAVLHSRLAGLGLDAQHDATWEQRTPAGASQLARELAAGLDARTRELGAQAAVQVQPWAAGRLGVGALAPGASPARRADWEHRAGIAAAYREAAGITDPEVDIAAEPHEGNPELETWRRMAIRALEIRDESELLRGMPRGTLEARVAEADRAMAAAPPEPSAQLRAAAQARAQAQVRAADAQVRSDAAAARHAGGEAAAREADQADLEGQMAAYERWSVTTAETRERGGKAKAELDRRGYEQREPERDSMLDWWARFEADLDKVGKAIAAERQAALDEGRPWPPARQARPEPQPEPEGVAEAGPEPEAEADPEPDPHAERIAALNAQLDKISARAGEIRAERAEHEASDAAYVQRQAEVQVQAEAEPAAEADLEPEA